MSNDITEFADEAISQMNKSITDKIFLLIQNDKNLMRTYLQLVEEHGINSVNTQIGKRVKEIYDLEDAERNENPISTLIKSYQEFITKTNI